MAPGQVVDEAVKLYTKHRELTDVTKKERDSTKLQDQDITVCQETLAYIRFMRDVMIPGN